MYILHIETSTKICSIALSREQDIIAHIDIAEGMNHAALLAPAIDQLLKSNQIHSKELSAISVNSGPGSYTGLRVGGSTAKAMAFALQIPILAVPGLLSLASSLFEKYKGMDLALPMLDARRNEVYTVLYDRDLNEVFPLSSILLEKDTLDEIIPGNKKVVACGDGAKKLDPQVAPAIIIDKTIISSAVHLVKPAYQKFTRQEYSDPMLFVPQYLKPPNITQQRKFI